jgi:triphosphoribosyl-dephospho-CoA synthase
MKGGSEDIARAFVEACLAELEAPKPGNVHRYAPGHGMQVADFVLSAEASAGPISASGARVGARIHGAVAATLKAIGQNTNLGIVLLCAPLAAAAERHEVELREALARVLDDLDEGDATEAFAAIVAANPGGLGRAPRHDVHAPVTATLREAMAEAADRDRIARQYVTSFEDVFSLGLPALKVAEASDPDSRWRTVAVYLAFLASFPDTHVVRKFGISVAEGTQADAARIRDGLARLKPDERMAALLAWDAELKARGVNPGTTADLTVATLFAARLMTMRARLLPSQANSA